MSKNINEYVANRAIEYLKERDNEIAALRKEVAELKMLIVKLSKSRDKYLRTFEDIGVAARQALENIRIREGRR